MTPSADPKKPEATFRRRPPRPGGATEGTTMAGAIVGGTIGAFTGGPIATVAGMAIGAFAARKLSEYVNAGEAGSSNGHTPSE